MVFFIMGGSSIITTSFWLKGTPTPFVISPTLVAGAGGGELMDLVPTTVQVVGTYVGARHNLFDLLCTLVMLLLTTAVLCICHCTGKGRDESHSHPFRFQSVLKGPTWRISKHPAHVDSWNC